MRRKIRQNMIMRVSPLMEMNFSTSIQRKPAIKQPTMFAANVPQGNSPPITLCVTVTRPYRASVPDAPASPSNNNFCSILLSLNAVDIEKSI